MVASVAAKTSLCLDWLRGYKTFFMLNSADQWKSMEISGLNHQSQSQSLYPPQTVFVGGYTVFTLSDRPTNCPCVRNVLFL